MADVVSRSANAKKQRQRELLKALHPDPAPEPQPRDAQGKFASKPGLDGGARRQLAQPQQPEQAHDETVLALARLSKFGQSGF